MPERDIEPARLAWQVLAAQATLRATITYTQLEGAIGWRGAAQGFGPVLDLVAEYCRAKGLPDITILVVLKETGRPSSGNTVYDVERERERVFAREWFKVPPPSEEALREFL